MSAEPVVEPTEESAVDACAVWLRSVLAGARESVTTDQQVLDAGRIDRIALYEVKVTTPTGHHYISQAPDPP